MSAQLDEEVDEDDDNPHKKRKLNDFDKPLPRPNIHSSSFAQASRPMDALEYQQKIQNLKPE